MECKKQTHINTVQLRRLYHAVVERRSISAHLSVAKQPVFVTNDIRTNIILYGTYNISYVSLGAIPDPFRLDPTTGSSPIPIKVLRSRVSCSLVHRTQN